MLTIKDIIVLLLLYLPFLGKNEDYIFILYLAIYATGYNIVLLRRIHRKKREIAIIMSQVFLELDYATRLSERTFNQATMAIENLHAKMQDNREELINALNAGMSKAVDIARPWSNIVIRDTGVDGSAPVGIF